MVIRTCPKSFPDTLRRKSRTVKTPRSPTRWLRRQRTQKSKDPIRGMNVIAMYPPSM